LIRKVLAEKDVPKYLLLLNSDTIVHPGCLEASVKAFEKEPQTGALSCMLRNADGSVQNVCRQLPSPLRMTLHFLGLPWTMPRLFGWADLEDPGWNREKESRDVGWVGGAFLLVRSDLVEKIGGLDEDFFFYGEDIEFCHRIKRNGYRVRFDPSGEITHLGGASSDSSRLLDERKVRLEWQARLLVQRKCYGRLAESWMRRLNLAILAWRWRGQRRDPESVDAQATLRARKILRNPWPET
jgi:GT2 family glycosyltransferase